MAQIQSQFSAANYKPILQDQTGLLHFDFIFVRASENLLIPF